MLRTRSGGLQSANVAALTMGYLEAVVTGDVEAVRATTTAALGAGIRLQIIGASHERLIATLAMAYVPPATTLIELRGVSEQIAAGLEIAQTAVLDFGARDPDSLRASVAAATGRLTEIGADLEQLAATGSAAWKRLFVGLSYGGRLTLARSLAAAITGIEDFDGWEVTASAWMCHLYSAADAERRLDAILGQN